MVVSLCNLSTLELAACSLRAFCAPLHAGLREGHRPALQPRTACSGRNVPGLWGVVAACSMSDDERQRAQDEDEERKIFQAIEASRTQVHENELREQRDSVIVRRGQQQQQAPRQSRHQQQQQQQQQHLRQAHPDAKGGKATVYAPKGIPSSMIVAQADPDEGAALAPDSTHLASTTGMPHRSQARCTQPGARQGERRAAPGACSPPDAHRFKSREPPAGKLATFTHGEIQQEQLEEEAEAKRIAEFKARLPELPPIATADCGSDRQDDADAAAGRLTGPAGRRRAGAGRAAIEPEAAHMPALDAGGMGGAIVATGAPGEGESCLWADLGFYVTKCLPWLPKGEPEQHFATLGLAQKLSRAEWEAWVAAETEEAAARRRERRAARRHKREGGEGRSAKGTERTRGSRDDDHDDARRASKRRRHDDARDGSREREGSRRRERRSSERRGTC